MEHVEPNTTSPEADPSRRQLLRARAWMLPVAIVALLAAVLWGATRGASGKKPITSAEVGRTAKTVVDKALKEAAAAPPRAALAYQTIGPSLVVIRTEDNRPTDASLVDDTSPETMPDGERFGLGTGVVINAEGAILTANHVVADASSIEVTFADGTKAKGEIVSQEAANDIAVLKTDRTPEVIVPAVLGGGVRVGDEVFAVGHPLGLVASLSAGVVSGLDRKIPLKNGSSLEGLIQFDAAVNPGNSGGPLLNRNGQVVGIVTALANPSEQGFFVGIGFAVTIATAGGAAGGPPQ